LRAKGHVVARLMRVNVAICFGRSLCISRLPAVCRRTAVVNKEIFHEERITGNRSLRESRRKRLGCGDDAAVKTSFRQERTYAVRFRPSRKRRC